MSSPTLEQVYGEYAQDHRELMELIAQVRARRGIVSLIPLLEKLHGLLIRHFSQEQFPGGLYECMGAYGTRHHEELKILVREHCVILSAMRGLLDRTLVAGAQDEPAVLNEVDEVLADLCDHERREYILADKIMASQRTNAT
jgi:malate synthase